MRQPSQKRHLISDPATRTAPSEARHPVPSLYASNHIPSLPSPVYYAGWVRLCVNVSWLSMGPPRPGRGGPKGIQAR